MICPGCNTETRHFSASLIRGKTFYVCDNSENHSGQKPRKFRSHGNRKFDKYELPKEEIRRTQAMAPKVRYPDSPKLRDIASVTPSRPRATVYEWGDTSRSSRNARVMNKLIGKLGPNPKIISDDGLKVVAESTTL